MKILTLSINLEPSTPAFTKVHIPMDEKVSLPNYRR